MTLTQLGFQYLREEEAVRKRLAQLREKLKICSPDEKALLEKRIYYLCTEAHDLKEFGEYLRSYEQPDKNEQSLSA